ncbi:hypothetical protein HMPREF1624_08386 [Sporothrix schenckii ATCC 58251]|uniref:Major facilitator superfamily (MFS) profile domain-containing protein n=1 Tax=Sporothrix schenckii (strain ATCC 58251 / de Perez 2211183) TaxID=1391915 RepID=U7PKX3_SPOS1|nr:hypothetical protein HMPREF1624_08386 [Sporothrix schenckii ATCC 58251]
MPSSTSKAGDSGGRSAGHKASSPEYDPFALGSDDDGDGDDDHDSDGHRDGVHDHDHSVPSERQGLVGRPAALGRAARTAPTDIDLDVDLDTDMDVDTNLTVRQAVRVYRKAIFWCLVTSACVIMEGYDMILIGNFFAYPAFAAKYGQFVDEHGQHQLTAAWMAALANAAPVGCFVGTALNGHLVARHGHKRVLLAALAVLSAFICLTFFAPTITVLLVGELLCGLPWGIFASSAPAYASELLPTALRSYLTSWTNMCFILGQLIAAAVLATLVNRRPDDEWAFRIPFALQWLWPLVIFPVLCFAPESPWHLVRTGRRSAARKALARLQTSSASASASVPGADIDATLATIERTNAMEKAAMGPAETTYADCFRGTERRRTEIACMAFAAQVLAGAPFAYNSTYFFQQVGLPTHTTYLLNTGGTCLALVGTLGNWFVLMPRYGRRTIFLGGMAAMACLLAAVGVLGLLDRRRTIVAVGLVQAALTLVWTFVFQLSVGQLGWAVPAEVGSTRLRQRTVCLARDAYYAASIAANVAQPYLLNPGALNLKGTVGLVWALLASAVGLWAWLRLPETKGRSYAALDWLFAQQTPTRQFATAPVPKELGGGGHDGGHGAHHGAGYSMVHGDDTADDADQRGSREMDSMARGV